jgi:light-regulated signal transduction histidine kinase (bacteriophytochrome)
VEAGNLDHRVGLDSRDEFGELAAGFDRMSGRLKASQDRLSLQAEELRRANDDLQAAYKELEAFSYSVSHDLRAPLRTIEGFSQIVLETYEDRLDERGRDYLQRIRRAVVRMEALIDDILRLSRLSRASMVLERVDLTGLAKSVVEGLREQEPDRRVAVDIEDGLAASGDRELLRAVLDNLLGNAWKFTRGREDARIEMGALRGDGEAIFYIRDNGAGFNPAYADKLFKPFQRLHSEREFPGTGIGLALVHRIVARHGGSVRAEGAAGQGATFTFSLPTMESARERTDDPARRG